MYNMTHPKKIAHDVHLIFMFKKNKHGDKLRYTLKTEYTSAPVPYY